jgi:hypothetical protein
VPDEGENSHGQQLADDIVRLRNSLALYRWWVWEVACALEGAPEPYAQRSAYALGYRIRRAAALRGVAAPPARPCSYCAGAHRLLYLVPPSRWRRPEDERLRVCPACYVHQYGSSAHWLLRRDEWPV